MEHFILILCLTGESVLSVGDKGKLVLRADNIELKQIITEFENRFALGFNGFSGCMDQKITLSKTGSQTEGIRGLLKQLEIKNYAYTFHGKRLTQVTIFPPSETLPGMKN